MQPERHLCVLRRIGGSLLNRHLIEGELFGALACYILKMNGALAEVFQCQRVEIVTASGGVEHIRLKHGVVMYAAQCDAVVGQDIGIVF